MGTIINTFIAGAGAFHDERCYACHKAGGVNCATCRRSYHNHCDPNGTYKASDTSAWFCHVCIGRGWLASPPALTPPASPVQTPADISTAQNRKALPSSRKRSSPAASRQRKGRSKSPGERPGPSTTASGVSHEPERPARARKSRYTTLPKDVDGALRILYTELEVAGESRQQVARLTDDVTRLKQELELAQKQLDLERQVSQSARALRQEVTRLTSEAAQQQANAEEVATLKREKQEMESELLATKAELTKMKQTLLDLKRSLSSLGEIS